MTQSVGDCINNPRRDGWIQLLYIPGEAAILMLEETVYVQGTDQNLTMVIERLRISCYTGLGWPDDMAMVIETGQNFIVALHLLQRKFYIILKEQI
ncbi:hypothetical protein BH09PAT2_BH09PAT2_05340 [soil metagenome]